MVPAYVHHIALVVRLRVLRIPQVGRVACMAIPLVALDHSPPIVSSPALVMMTVRQSWGSLAMMQMVVWESAPLLNQLM